MWQNSRKCQRRTYIARRPASRAVYSKDLWSGCSNSGIARELLDPSKILFWTWKDRSSPEAGPGGTAEKDLVGARSRKLRLNAKRDWLGRESAQRAVTGYKRLVTSNRTPASNRKRSVWHALCRAAPPASTILSITVMTSTLSSEFHRP